MPYSTSHGSSLVLLPLDLYWLDIMSVVCCCVTNNAKATIHFAHETEIWAELGRDGSSAGAT